MHDLIHRMRTCAAHILARKALGDPWATEVVATDAADLLIDAAAALNGLVVPPPSEKPMEIIPPISAPTQMPEKDARKPPDILFSGIGSAPQPGVWIGSDLPPLTNTSSSRNTCPNCDSRTQKIVRRYNKKLTLECPVCGQQWDYAKR